jgi:hypothetical protein
LQFSLANLNPADWFAMRREAAHTQLFGLLSASMRQYLNKSFEVAALPRPAGSKIAPHVAQALFTLRRCKPFSGLNPPFS